MFAATRNVPDRGELGETAMERAGVGTANGGPARLGLRGTQIAFGATILFSRLLFMGLRERLKVETAHSHEALEQRLNLTDSAFGKADLLHLLAGFYGYYATCEDHLANTPAPFASYLSERRKCHRLINDLKLVGYDEEAVARLPRCPLRPLTTIPELLGRWYVLEGSTLGGQFVARHLQQRLGMPREACSFFLSYGAEVGLKWREFCDLLEQHSSTAHDDVTVETANATFASLSQWLLSGDRQQLAERWSSEGLD